MTVHRRHAHGRRRPRRSRNATLDPAQPGAGGTYSGPVTVKFSALDAAPAEQRGRRRQRHGVDAVRRQCQAPATPSRGASTSDAGCSHDLKLQSPAGAQLETLSDALRAQQPADHQAARPGRHVDVHLHVPPEHDRHRGRLSGPSSGVDYTESRVDGGAWGKGTSLTVSAPGSHTVEFRSADKAGNVETANSVGFSIQPPVTPLPTVQPTATPAPPAATPHAGSVPGAVVQAGHARRRRRSPSSPSAAWRSVPRARRRCPVRRR